jgi:hypothetical protein
MSSGPDSVCFQVARQNVKPNVTSPPLSISAFLFYTMVHQSHLRVGINLHHNDIQLHRNDGTDYCYSRLMALSLEIGRREPIYDQQKCNSQLQTTQKEINSLFNHKYVTVINLGLCVQHIHLVTL